MAQYTFGSGSFYGIPTGSNQTPSRFGTLQNASVDFKANAKELFGTNQFAETVARGQVSVTGKANFARFSARAFNDVFFGTSVSSAATGQTVVIDAESGTIPGSSTYTVTVTNSATWVLDLGVTYALTGLPLTRGSTASAAGIYSVAAGVYTFNASDASLGVKIGYTYTIAGGETLTLSNAAMGIAPTFKMVLSQNYNSQNFAITLNACVSTGMSITTALEDFAKNDFMFSAFIDPSNVLGTICYAEKM